MLETEIEALRVYYDTQKELQDMVIATSKALEEEKRASEEKDKALQAERRANEEKDKALKENVVIVSAAHKIKKWQPSIIDREGLTYLYVYQN